MYLESQSPSENGYGRTYFYGVMKKCSVLEVGSRCLCSTRILVSDDWTRGDVTDS